MMNSSVVKPSPSLLQAITAADVEREYSGRQGCMCGCIGRYYKSGAMVSKVLNILKADADTMLQDGYILFTDDKVIRASSRRNYVVYLKKPLTV